MRDPLRPGDLAQEGRLGRSYVYDEAHDLFRWKTEGRICMQVMVDGSERGRAVTYTNERNSHKAFVDDFIVLKGMSAGSQTIALENLYDSEWCGGTEELPGDHRHVPRDRH